MSAVAARALNRHGEERLAALEARMAAFENALFILRAERAGDRLREIETLDASQWMTVGVAAQRLQRTKSAVYASERKGRLAGRRERGRLWIDAASVEARCKGATLLYTIKPA